MGQPVKLTWIGLGFPIHCPAVGDCSWLVHTTSGLTRIPHARCRRLASALAQRGIGRGDTVAATLWNMPEMFECHFGVPMSGAVLNTINVRLDPRTIAFMLDHSERRC
jgi:fatty-acyl-CoA synthase